MKQKTKHHGGDLDVIERIYHIPKAEIIDFASNVSPLGVPGSVRRAITENLDALSSYPDISYVKLREAISDYTGVDVAHILVGNGATELIALFIKSVLGETCRKKAVIIDPAYSEYRREVENFGLFCDSFPLSAERGFALDTNALLNALTDDVALLALCNPNNPTGSVIKNDVMAVILAHAEARGIAVLIDETYAEFAEADDVSGGKLCARFPNLFTVRGTSKFFAVPGLRLGYGFCGSVALLAQMWKNKDPWSVNSLAEVAGRSMFRDTEYIENAKRLMFTERRKMLEALKAWPIIEAYDSHANFILLRLSDSCPLSSEDIFDALIKKRILVRDCNNYSILDDRYIRFCIQKPEQNALLLSELSKILNINA